MTGSGSEGARARFGFTIHNDQLPLNHGKAHAWPQALLLVGIILAVVGVFNEAAHELGK
jgi:hypothetical protein